MMPEPPVFPTVRSIPVRGMKSRRTALLVFCYLLALAALLWPAFYNGQPLFFSDTIGYFDRPLRVIREVFGQNASLISGGGNDISNTIPTAEAPPATVLREPEEFIMGGRSPYYGLLITTGYLLGGFWASIAIQGVITIGSVALLYRLLRVTNPFLAPCSIIIFAGISPLAFFNSYLMPDFLTGIVIIATVALLTCIENMRRSTVWIWLLLLAYAICTHSSHLGIAILLSIAAPVVYIFLSKPVPWRGMGIVLAAIIVGIGAQVLVSQVVKSAYGVAPTGPPFLSARFAQDSPGVDFLKETCPQNGFEICQFVDKLPVHSDEFLWSRDPHVSAFATASTETRNALSEEQFALALEVMRYDALGQIKTSLINFLHQLVRFRVNEFALGEGQIDYISRSLENAVGDFRVHNLEGAIYNMNYLVYAAAFFSIVIVVYLWAMRRRFMPGMFSAFTLLVFTGVLSNAAIAGMLSTVHDRYQARVVWLLPTLALLTLVLSRDKRRMPS